MKEIEKELRKIKKALDCQTTALLETRPLCFVFNSEGGEGGENPCYNIYGIYKVDENATTLVRYETQFGELIDDEVLATTTFLPCTCDCIGTGNPLIDLGGEEPLV